MATLFSSLLINKHGQKKGYRHHDNCRAYPNGSKKQKKHEAKIRDVASKSREIQD